MGAPPSSPPSAPPSYLLEGRYLAEKLLAHGDTADVFWGTDTWSGEQVAIRRLRADRADRAPEFRRMAERLFGTASPRLLRAMHVGEDRERQPFLVTELLMGRDVERLGRVRWEVACEVARQAAVAIAEMHLLGLHHGALRPSTFFVAAANVGGSRVKLLDLGTGDPAATAAKDVRALFAILHRLLVGRPPLPANVRPARLLTSVAGAPPALEIALGRWLATEGERIGAADVANELKAIIDSANSEFWSGGPSSSGAHELPRPSRISVATLDPEDEDD
jgi:serine/threonine protein kinase